MSVFFTSDQHFDHTNVIEYCSRPFSSVEEMNETLIANYNAIVKEKDIVYHLGDFSLGRKALRYVCRLNGTKFLVPGNHDKCHYLQYKKKVDKGIRLRKEYYDAGFALVYDEQHTFHDGRTDTHFVLHHMPYRTDDNSERYHGIRLEDKGSWLLHGHVHCAWLKRGRQINVGVDVHRYAPVPLETIRDLIKE